MVDAIYRMYNKPIELKRDKTLGYIYFLDKNHPLADKVYKVYYHRHVMSLHLGRWIGHKEHVHHINHDRSDNRIENLELLTPKEHGSLHGKSKTAFHPYCLLPKVCPQCKNEFKPIGKRSKYCSKKCVYLSRKIPKTKTECKVCNIPIEFNRSDPRKYCSQKCSQISQRKQVRPPRDQFVKEVDTMSWREIGHKYNICPRTAKKWAKAYNLL